MNTYTFAVVTASASTTGRLIAEEEVGCTEVDVLTDDTVQARREIIGAKMACGLRVVDIALLAINGYEQDR